VVSVIVVADVLINTKFSAKLRGKMTPLEQTDKELHAMISEEWTKRGDGRSLPRCFVTKGETSHSNCYVDSNKVVIFESLFEHVRERYHLISIIRHEMGHAIYNHVPKIILMRVLYYDIFFVGITFLVKYRDSWLPMFGITYNSLFLCMFVIIHFIHFKIAYYLYQIIENSVQRGFEYFCDNFAITNVSD
jgi:Zn-dependent protease with chaperone function